MKGSNKDGRRICADHFLPPDEKLKGSDNRHVVIAGKEFFPTLLILSASKGFIVDIAPSLVAGVINRHQIYLCVIYVSLLHSPCHTNCGFPPPPPLKTYGHIIFCCQNIGPDTLISG